MTSRNCRSVGEGWLQSPTRREVVKQVRDMPLEDPNSLATQLIARVCVIAMFWGGAWGVGWLAGSSIVFYLIGALGTVMGIQGIIREIRLQRRYRPDLHVSKND
jgi:predicted phage tail protein